LVQAIVAERVASEIPVSLDQLQSRSLHEQRNFLWKKQPQVQRRDLGCAVLVQHTPPRGPDLLNPIVTCDLFNRNR